MATVAAAFLTFAAVPVADAADPRLGKCERRAHAYVDHKSEGHPEDAVAERFVWMMEQCRLNELAVDLAERHGYIANEVFTRGYDDRNAHPVSCFLFSNSRFGKTPNTGNKIDPDAPGGSPMNNVVGEYMVAPFVIGGVRLFQRHVVWTIADQDGDAVSPVRMKQLSFYQQQGLFDVANLRFKNAYEPVSVWVEVLETAAVAAHISDESLLPGRGTSNRAWHPKSGCHDKRSPIIIPDLIIDRALELGWTSGEPAEIETSLILRLGNDGDRNEPDDWYVYEVPVERPSPANWKQGHPSFYDEDVDYSLTPGAEIGRPGVVAIHPDDTLFTGETIQIDGWVYDNHATDKVKIAIRDRATGKWLKHNGTFGTNKTKFGAIVRHSGDAFSTWKFRVSLPQGDYDLWLKAIDEYGNTRVMKNQAPFTVDG